MGNQLFGGLPGAAAAGEGSEAEGASGGEGGSRGEAWGSWGAAPAGGRGAAGGGEGIGGGSPLTITMSKAMRTADWDGILTLVTKLPPAGSNLRKELRVSDREQTSVQN